MARSRRLERSSDKTLPGQKATGSAGAPPIGAAARHPRLRSQLSLGALSRWGSAVWRQSDRRSSQKERRDDAVDEGFDARVVAAIHAELQG